MSGQDLEWLERIPMHQPAWLFLMMLLMLGFLAWIRVYYSGILYQSLQASANFQVAARMFKDNSVLQTQLDSVLYMFYFMSTAFFLYLVEGKFSWMPYGLQGFRLYAFNLAFLVGVFMLRVVLVNLAGFLFNRVFIFREYLYHSFIFNKIAGVLTLPVLMFAFYMQGFLQDIFQWTAIGMVTALIFMRIIRGIVFSYRKGISKFYMFLYLCALEIAPLLLLFRWLEGTL